MATEASRAAEAILLVAEEPVEPQMLAQLLEVSPARVDELCAELAASYQAEDRGFVLVRVAGGYRFQTAPELAPYVERFVLDGQPTRLSPAALETLAVVAYRQPVSRPQVASIRGVNADAVMRTLAHRGYIEEVGRDPGPGQAVLYGTTSLFLEKLGLDSLAGLPPLSEFVPGPEVVDAFERSLGAAARAGGDQSGSDQSGSDRSGSESVDR
jgi:segregation and condensation protein B